MLVRSSNIHEVTFTPQDHSEGILTVVFHSGATYCYDKVPYRMYKQMVVAESVGKYFEANIKKGGFKYTKMANERATSVVADDPLIQQFGDIVNFLEKKGIARREEDEHGNVRVIFNGEYAKELAWRK